MQNEAIFLEFSLKYDDGAPLKLGPGAKCPPSWHPCYNHCTCVEFLHVGIWDMVQDMYLLIIMGHRLLVIDNKLIIIKILSSRSGLPLM